MKRWPVGAAGAVDEKNAPTAPWKPAKRAVFHSSHEARPVSIECCITLFGDQPYLGPPRP